jgi:hypothetical protein
MVKGKVAKHYDEVKMAFAFLLIKQLPLRHVYIKGRKILNWYYVKCEMKWKTREVCRCCGGISSSVSQNMRKNVQISSFQRNPTSFKKI